MGCQVCLQLCFYLSMLQLALTQRSTESCLTFQGEPGVQTVLRSCPYLMKCLDSDKPKQEQLQYVKKFQLGWQDKVPVVCCPYNSTGVTQLANAPGGSANPSNSSERVEIPHEELEDVMNHKNLKLMPQHCGLVFEAKIIKGENTDLFQFPWMALLGYKDDKEIKYYCGGSLVNDKYVLTAAHCVSDLKIRSTLQVRLGEYDLKQSEDCTEGLGCADAVQDMKPEKVTIHPDYNEPTLRCDIALIRLQGVVVMSRSVAPVCLPVGEHEQSKTLEKVRATVTGWGATKTGPRSDVLQMALTKMREPAECTKIYKMSDSVAPRILCSGGDFDAKGACKGDSGGPLQDVSILSTGTVGYLQYGVVSFGPEECGAVNRPVVYTKVGYFMKWLLDTIQP